MSAEYDDMPELQQARGLWQSRRFNESLQLFDRVVRTHPNNALALVDAARAFGNRFEIVRAEELLARLRAMCGTDAHLLTAAGQVYRNIGRWESAGECFRSAATASNENMEPLLELAQVHDRWNQIEQGRSCIEQLLARQPDSPDGRLVYGHLMRRLGNVGESESSLRRLSSDSATPAAIRVSAFYELGYLLDEHEQFDAAFDAVLKAKELQQVDATELQTVASQSNANLMNLANRISQSDFIRWREQGESLPPEKVAFLIGSPRSGTTLLERVLSGHDQITSTDEAPGLPQVFLPELVNYRRDNGLDVSVLNGLTRGQIKIARDRYARYISAVLQNDCRRKQHIDKNPSLIGVLPILIRIYPEAKILFALRDPRDILVSCFMRNFPLNSVSVNYLTLAGTADAIQRDWKIWTQLRDRLPEPGFEVRYEELVTNLEATARKTLEYLGVSWDPVVMDFHQRSSAVTSPTYEAVSKPIYQQAMGRWRNYESRLGEVNKILQPFLEAFQYD